MPPNSTEQRPALPLLLTVNVAVLICLLGLVVFNTKTTGTPEAPQSIPKTFDKAQLRLATNTLEKEAEKKEIHLVSALLPHAERGVTDFVSLQVIAAEMRVKAIEWVYLPQDNNLVPVEMDLRASGSYYNLPILLAGLYRQSRPVQITFLSVETPKAMVVQTEIHLRLRFHRPPPATTAWLTQKAEEIALADDPAGTFQALNEAAKLQRIADFEKELPRLKAGSVRNHRAIMTTVPGLLRRLPTSALGWVGLELRDGELVILSEP
jgi:hypothetical protein